MIDLFVKKFFCKLCQNSSLSFILPTRTQESTPCQRISFFEYFFTFFDFFEKTIKITAVSIHCKGSNYPKLSTVLWYNHYLCNLKLFLKKIILRYTSSDYFTEPSIILKNVTSFNEYAWRSFWPFFQKNQRMWKNTQKMKSFGMES